MPYIAPPFTPTVTISGTDLIRNTDEKLQTIANDVGDYLETQTQEALTELEDTMGGIEAQFDVINSESNGYVTQALNAKNQAETAATTATTQAGIATTKANEASISAATATAKANLATSVVIPTSATYSYTANDIRDTIQSKSAFNAIASERRANRAGSGYDELDTTLTSVNSGISTSLVANTFIHGNARFSINGVINRYLSQSVIMPNAPTIYPYDATLTPEQIAMGVIKHADSSNSGLIVNGKFNTDTSGWAGANGASLSVDTNRLKIQGDATSYPFAYQTIATVIGKKYKAELNSSSSANIGFSAYNGNPFSGGVSIITSVSTSPANAYSSIEFTATSATTWIILSIESTVDSQIAYFDNIAVFPADAISRSDLVFLESWHEDVSEKDFVYPLGNVQYLGGAVDGLSTPTNGAFSGFGTYSLFGNWQASGALVGKGYVWSTLTDAQKKAFVANPENNVYLDGDKYIQVRYRVRVVAGMGDNWTNVDPNTSATGTSAAMKYSTSYVKAKAKQVFEEDMSAVLTTGSDWLYSGNAQYGYKSINGIFDGVEATGAIASNSLAYEGKCYALPIALVHRRNQGGYNATYNLNGTKSMTMTPTSISDCFNNANLNTSTGYIGTSTPRPDGLFYDQVSVNDFKPSNKGADLRNSSKKRTAQNIIEEFAPKVIAGTLLYNNNDTTPLTTYKDFMEVRDTSGNRYAMKSKIGNVVNIVDTVANKKGFSVVTQNGKQYLQVADDATSDTTVQMNLSTIKYDIGVFDA